ncbi:HNH endonuclease [Candidatus Jorgensenbacteria bacterium]|nr:HNH endonuclease [Candidatus Jorgensenbacteria bacterium]
MINKKRKIWRWKLADRLNLSEVRKKQWLNGFKGSTGKHWMLSEKTRKLQGLRQIGEKNYMWKNNATERNFGFYLTNAYKLWHKEIIKRDGNMCVLCGSKKQLEADHIKPRSLFPKLALIIDNGRTLCHECHKKTDTYSGRVHKLAII